MPTQAQSKGEYVAFRSRQPPCTGPHPSRGRAELMNIIQTLILVIALGATTVALSPPPQKSEPYQQAPAAPQANAGSQNATTPATAMPRAGESDATLQGRIQQALQNESGLDASHVSVKVTDTAIELSGSVPSGEDKQTAQRIAQSFDGNRKF